MSTSRWQELLSRLEIYGELRPVSVADVDHFESSTGILLPTSYKEYCCTFGLGELSDPLSYRIKVPGTYSPIPADDLQEFQCEVRTYKNEFREYCGDIPRFERAYFFAVDIGTDHYFWDLGEVTDAVNSEHQIYVLQRDWKILPLASSFWSFVTDICLTSGPPGWKMSEIVPVFTPVDPKDRR